MVLIGKFLQVVGALAVGAVLVTTAVVGYGLANNRDRIDRASASDVSFVLNWGGLDSNQEVRVLSSAESARSFTGDHLDYYCLQLSAFEPASQQREAWVSPQALSAPLFEAVSDAFAVGKGAECFGAATLDALPGALSYVWSATLHGLRVTAFDLMLYDPGTKRLLFVSLET